MRCPCLFFFAVVHLFPALHGCPECISQAESTLKKIQADTSGASGVSQSEAKLRGNVVRTLAGRLQDKSVAFRRTQKDFLARRSDQKVPLAGSNVDSGLHDVYTKKKTSTHSFIVVFCLKFQVFFVSEFEYGLHLRGFSYVHLKIMNCMVVSCSLS